MANANAPRGLVPISSPHVNVEIVEEDITAAAVELRIGDPVVRIAAGTVSRATAGTGNKIYGAIVGIKSPTGLPVDLYPSMTVPPTGYKALVAVDTNQEFAVVEDSVGGSLALTDRGANANIVFGTVPFSGKSGCRLDSSSVATTAGHQLRIIRPTARINNVVGDDYCEWVVKINNHQAMPANLGEGV